MTTDIDRLIAENEQNVERYRKDMRRTFEETQAKVRRIRRNADIAMALVIPLAAISFVVAACVKAYVQLYC